jgi:hypothetical protein
MINLNTFSFTQSVLEGGTPFAEYAQKSTYAVGSSDTHD